MPLYAYFVGGLCSALLGGFFSMLGPSVVGVLQSLGVTPRRWASAIGGALVGPLFFGGLMLFVNDQAHINWPVAITEFVAMTIAGGIGGWLWFPYWRFAARDTRTRNQ